MTRFTAMLDTLEHRSLSNFFQCPPPQSLHRKQSLRHFAALLRRVGDFALQVAGLVIAAELAQRRFVQLKQNFTQLLGFGITGRETLSVNLAQCADEGVSVLVADFTIPVAVAIVETCLAHAALHRA
jgi:hypothetical protein